MHCQLLSSAARLSVSVLLLWLSKTMWLYLNCLIALLLVVDREFCGTFHGARVTCEPGVGWMC